jgi:hypothetical protein
MNDLLPDSIFDSLPAWIIERAAAYMLRRYGRAAMMRAAARHRLLLDQGEHAVAADWLRVTEEIERLGNARPGRARRLTPAPDVSRSGH